MNGHNSEGQRSRSTDQRNINFPFASSTLPASIPPPAQRPGSRHIPWPHAPLHQLSQCGTYFVTAGTLHKQHYFRGKLRLEVLHRGLLTVAKDYGWNLAAWTVFSNHYHFVAHSPGNAEGATSLPEMLGQLHGKLAVWVNQLDHTPGRKVWYNYRETRLTYERSLLARLKYVHQNAVHHGLVPIASAYPWCSATWFERAASPALVKTIYGFPIDKLRVDDEYGTMSEW